jgi:pimeloyl-ACP methyl ester carboxylesterase
MAFRQEQVSVRQGLFDVRLHRGGAGAPLVYLHGAGGQAAIDPFLEALAEEREVIVPIHPGWPGSEGLDHIDDAVDMAIYYLDLFDALGLEQVDLIGASLGGMFAAEIAAIGGSYVRRLGLCEPAGLWLDEHVPLDFFAAGQEQLSRAVFYDADLAARRAAAAAEADDPARAGLDRTQALAAASKFLWPIWDKGLKKRLHRI